MGSNRGKMSQRKSSRRKGPFVQRTQPDRFEHLIVHETCHMIVAKILGISIAQFQIHAGEFSIDGHASIEVDAIAASFIQDTLGVKVGPAGCPQKTRLEIGKLVMFWIAGSLGDTVILQMPYNPPENSEDDYILWRKGLIYFMNSEEEVTLNDAQGVLIQGVNKLILAPEFSLLLDSFRGFYVKNGKSVVNRAQIDDFFEYHRSTVDAFSSIDFIAFLEAVQRKEPDRALKIISRE